MDINTVEAISAGLGLLQGILVMLNLRCNWIVYVAQMLFMVVFSLMSRLYGDAVNSAVYVLVGVLGYLAWGTSASAITMSSKKQTMALLGLFAVGSTGLYAFLRITDDPLPLVDSLTTVSSFIATWLMAWRRLDAWIWWLCNDLLYVVTYYLLPEQAWWLLSLNVVWTAMAVVSYYNWSRVRLKG